MNSEKKVRVIKLPTGALVIQKKEENIWKRDFSISPIEKNLCSICGHPLPLDKECTYHTELLDLPIDFSLCYGGYYQSDLKNKPLNEYSKRIRQFNTKDIELFLKILIKRWESLPDKDDYNWITIVPSKNKNIPRLARLFAERYDLLYIAWKNIFHYTPIKSIRYIRRKMTRRQLVKDKYSINLPSLQKTKNKITGNGIIMDDILNTGTTISYILRLLAEHIDLSKVKGLTLARTKGKKIKYVKFPKF